MSGALSHHTKVTERQIKLKTRGFKCFKKVDLIAAIVEDSKVIIYRISLEIVHVITLPQEHKIINFIEWSPNGRELSILCSTGELFLADVDTGKVNYTSPHKFINSNFMIWLSYDFDKCSKEFESFHEMDPDFDVASCIINEPINFKDELATDFDHKNTTILLIGGVGVVYCCLYGRFPIKIKIGDDLSPLYAHFDAYCGELFVVADKGSTSSRVLLKDKLDCLARNLPNLFRISSYHVILHHNIKRISEVLTSAQKTWSSAFIQLEKILRDYQKTTPDPHELYFSLTKVLLDFSDASNFVYFFKNRIPTTLVPKFTSNYETNQQKTLASFTMLFYLCYSLIMSMLCLKAFTGSTGDVLDNPVNDSIALAGVLYLKTIRLIYYARADVRDNDLFFGMIKSMVTSGDVWYESNYDDILMLIDRKFGTEREWRYHTRVREFMETNKVVGGDPCEIGGQLLKFLPGFLGTIKNEQSPFDGLLSGSDPLDISFHDVLGCVRESLSAVFDPHNSVDSSPQSSDLGGDCPADNISFFGGKWLCLAQRDPFSCVFVDCDRGEKIAVCSFPSLGLKLFDIDHMRGSIFVVLGGDDHSRSLTKIDVGQCLASGDWEDVRTIGSYRLSDVAVERVVSGGGRNYALLVSPSTVVTVILDIEDAPPG